MIPGPIRWLLWREYLDQRQNRMLWPILVIIPLIGAALPAILAVGSAALLSQQAANASAELNALIAGARMLATIGGIDLERAAALMLLRLSAGYYLLMPLAIVSIAGAHAIVGEKQQRTLEPVLATPIGSAAFLLGKLLAVLLPSLLITGIAALLGATVAMLSFWLVHGLLVWPDAIFWIAVGVLGPEVGAITALVCLRVSARMQDPQAANQITGLMLTPALLIVLGLTGPFLIQSVAALAVACVLGAFVVYALYRWVRAGFDREEILCRWR
jgi:ABC-2 type transport system permease protein